MEIIWKTELKLNFNLFVSRWHISSWVMGRTNLVYIFHHGRRPYRMWCNYEHVQLELSTKKEHYCFQVISLWLNGEVFKAFYDGRSYYQRPRLRDVSPHTMFPLLNWFRPYWRLINHDKLQYLKLCLTSFFCNFILQSLTYYRQKEQPHSEKGTTNPTLRAVVVGKHLSTSKRRLALHADTQPRKFVISIGERRLRVGGLLVQEGWGTWRQWPGSLRMDSEKVHRPRRWSKTRSYQTKVKNLNIRKIWTHQFLTMLFSN